MYRRSVKKCWHLILVGKIDSLRYFSGFLVHDFEIQNLGLFFLVLALRGSFEEAYTLNEEPFSGFLYQSWEEIVQGLQFQRCVEIRELLLRTLHIRRIALCFDVTIVFFFCDAECLHIYNWAGIIGGTKRGSQKEMPRFF